MEIESTTESVKNVSRHDDTCGECDKYATFHGTVQQRIAIVDRDYVSAVLADYLF